MFLLVLTALFCLSSFGNGYPIVDCGSNLGNLGQVIITGCDKTKNTCILHRGQNASIEIDFTTKENATELETVVHGTVLIVPIPFHVPYPNACSDPNSGITCPLTKGKSFRYKATLPVDESYPSVSVTIKWELRDQNGNDIVCIKLPAKLR